MALRREMATVAASGSAGWVSARSTPPAAASAIAAACEPMLSGESGMPQP